MSSHPRLIAIYDLDRTITQVPTWTPFLLYAAWSLAPWRLALVPVAAGAAALHLARLIDRRTLKQIMHALMIGPRAREDIARVADRFAARYADRHIAPGARARIAADRAAGYRIVVATAAHRFYAAPLVATLGIDDLVATEARIDSFGRVLPAIAGANCYGADKHAMITRWLADSGASRAASHIRFYSDHRSDRPTFEWVDEPFAVDPHPPLRHLANARGWPILSWRSAAPG